MTAKQIQALFLVSIGTITTDSVSEGASNFYYTASRFNSSFSAKSTSDLSEGTNLYYTAARFNSALSSKSTSDLTEGTNLYYTNTRFNSQLATKSTSDLSEGANLYYTDVRADARITAQKGFANGLASLDATGKLETSQIPASLIGAANYQGAWNANTNSPALSNGSGAKGYYYVVTTAGSTSLDGITDWKIGDWAISNGTIWQKVDNTDAVISVFGRIGAIVATSGDYTTDLVTEGSNLYYTTARWDTQLATKTTTNLTEGSNLYYTAARFNTAFGTKSTSDLSEGTNLYYTQSRFDTAIAVGGFTLASYLRFSGTTNAGLRVKSLSTTDRDAIASPANGDLIYNSTTSRFNVYSGGWMGGWARIEGDTFTGTVVAPNITNSGLTAGRVVYSGTAGAQADNSGLTFDSTLGLNVGNKNTTNQRFVRIGQDTAFIDVGSLVGATANGAFYLGQATPSTTNYALMGASTTTFLNSTTTLGLRISNSPRITVTTGDISFTPAAVSSGATTVFTFTTAASTGQTAGTETIGTDWDNTAGITHASNTGYALQRDNYWRGRLHKFASATGTITDAYTGYFDAPTASTNAAITRAWALGVNGRLGVATNIYVGGLTTAATALIHFAAGTSTANTAPIQFTNGTRETTARGGLVEYENNVYVTNNSLVRYGLGGTIFDHANDVGNVTTAETDLYSDTLAINTLAVNKDKVVAEYGGKFVSSGTATRQIKIYFAGTVILDTGALTLSLSSAWTVYVALIRVSSTVVRYECSLTTQGAALAAYTSCDELTGLTLSNTNILKITGTAAGVGAATNDIVAKMGFVEVKAAA